jgi:dipeptidyl aminopeptidase/acylaminoacyl peptidase
MKRLRLLAVPAFTAAVLLPVSAHAAPPSEVLAYVGPVGIYVSSPPGAAGVQVVDSGLDPAVSADGARLAWVARAADGYPHVFVGSTAGGAGTQVTSGPASDATPVWSPDGRRVALTRFGHDGLEHIALVDADGTNGRMLDVLGSSPTWSPDGRFLAFRDGSGLGLGSVDAEGRGWALISRDLGQPSWSPDGSQIVTVSSNVRMLDLATRSVRTVLAARSELPAHWFEDVTFNAAGDRLYVRHVEVRGKVDFTDDIRRYTLDGTEDGSFSPISQSLGYGGGPERRLSVGGSSRPTPPATSPASVTQLVANTSPSRIQLTWTPPAATSQFAGFTVRYAMGSTPPATVSDGLPAGDTLGTALLVGRLAASTSYSFSVFTRDWSGAASPAATATATTPAQVATTLTLTGPGTITYGQASVLSGQLIREDTGAPVADATVTLLGHHTGQRDTTLSTLTTDANGRFSTRRLTSEATRYTARYAGSTPLLAATTSSLVLVRQRITITFSPSSHPPAYSRATVTATVAPPFPGGNVRVQQISFSGHDLLTKLNSRSQVTVRLDTSRRDATALVHVTPGARTGYLADLVEAPFQISCSACLTGRLGSSTVTVTHELPIGSLGARRPNPPGSPRAAARR